MIASRVPTIYNVTLTTAGTEQSKDLQTDPNLPSIKRIQVKSRTANDLKYSYITAGPYVTIPAGLTYWQDIIDAWIITIFLTGTINGQVAEIEVWS